MNVDPLFRKCLQNNFMGFHCQKYDCLSKSLRNNLAEQFLMQIPQLLTRCFYNWDFKILSKDLPRDSTTAETLERSSRPLPSQITSFVPTRKRRTLFSWVSKENELLNYDLSATNGKWKSFSHLSLILETDLVKFLITNIFIDTKSWFDLKCHLMFISPSHKYRMPSIRTKFLSLPSLPTVFEKAELKLPSLKTWLKPKSTWNANV